MNLFFFPEFDEQILILMEFYGIFWRLTYFFGPFKINAE